MFKIALPTSRVELLPGNQAHCPWYILKSFTAQALEYITSFDNAGASSVFPNFVRFNFTAASSSCVAFPQVSHWQSSLGFLCSKIRCCDLLLGERLLTKVDSIFTFNRVDFRSDRLALAISLPIACFRVVVNGILVLESDSESF